MEFKVIKKEEILKTLKGINRNIMEFKVSAASSSKGRNIWINRNIMEFKDGLKEMQEMWHLPN